jgi:hypothetical protein
MKIDIKAMALTLALVWGAFGMFLTGVGSVILPGYGQTFLDAMASVYPGYTAEPSFGQAVIGGLYGVLDGAGVGALVAWLYNTLAARSGN